MTAIAPETDPAGPATGGRDTGQPDDAGTLTIDPRVLQKVAAAAAAEVDDAGAPSVRGLGRAMTAAPVLGAMSASPGNRPKVSAEVDGGEVVLQLSMSVRWPASIPAVTTAVRDRVREQITGLTGMTVGEVVIVVTDLVTGSAEQLRVH